MKTKNTHNAPPMPNRRSIRLKGYDYAHIGPYHVTICTQNRECLFGDRWGGHMVLNHAGRMVQIIWNQLGQYYPGIETDAFQIMPNHIYGVIVIVRENGQPRGVAPTGLSLPDVVHRFKSLTTNRYVAGVKNSDWAPFPGRLWQRNYYERIIRNENELNNIRKYITTNPARWKSDRENTNP